MKMRTVLKENFAQNVKQITYNIFMKECS